MRSSYALLDITIGEAVRGDCAERHTLRFAQPRDRLMPMGLRVVLSDATDRVFWDERKHRCMTAEDGNFVCQ
jgi:hypothetical protein